MTFTGHLGTTALERLIVKALKALKLDKDGNGKVTPGEIFSALTELAPEFFNISDIIDESRDLSGGEIQHLCNVAAANLPDYPNVRAEVEDLVKSILELAGCVTKVIVAYGKMNVPAATTPKAAIKVPTSPTADQKARPGSDKQ